MPSNFECFFECRRGGASPSQGLGLGRARGVIGVKFWCASALLKNFQLRFPDAISEAFLFPDAISEGFLSSVSAAQMLGDDCRPPSAGLPAGFRRRFSGRVLVVKNKV